MKKLYFFRIFKILRYHKKISKSRYKISDSKLIEMYFNSYYTKKEQ